jgi:hypothetical protein
VVAGLLPPDSPGHRSHGRESPVLNSELDLTAAMTALDEPFKLDAEGFFQGQQFSIDANLDSLEAATTGQPAKLVYQFH